MGAAGSKEKPGAGATASESWRAISASVSSGHMTQACPLQAVGEAPIGADGLEHELAEPVGAVPGEVGTVLHAHVEQVARVGAQVGGVLAVLVLEQVEDVHVDAAGALGRLFLVHLVEAADPFGEAIVA